MPFYLTGNPVPSASVLDIRDNSQNLDLALNDITSILWADRLGRHRMTWYGIESSFSAKLIDFEFRFVSQITEQETTFKEAQTDKENRFQTFLDSSGYVFLGDYEDGPFQFGARNQYIRYDNQYYRLNATTDVGFTTTGTDATSFANDVTHFVLMDGDTLRQDLGSGEAGLGVNLVYGALKQVSLTNFLSLVDLIRFDNKEVVNFDNAIAAAKLAGLESAHLPNGHFGIADTTSFANLLMVGSNKSQFADIKLVNSDGSSGELSLETEGTVLHISGTAATTGITLSNSGSGFTSSLCGIIGCSIYYPDQDWKDWTQGTTADIDGDYYYEPTVYPPTFVADAAMRVIFDNLFFINSYHWIDIKNAQLVTFGKIAGSLLNRGYTVTRMAAGGVTENFNSYPFWTWACGFSGISSRVNHYCDAVGKGIQVGLDDGVTRTVEQMRIIHAAIIGAADGIICGGKGVSIVDAKIDNVMRGITISDDDNSAYHQIGKAWVSSYYRNNYIPKQRKDGNVYGFKSNTATPIDLSGLQVVRADGRGVWMPYASGSQVKSPVVQQCMYKAFEFGSRGRTTDVISVNGCYAGMYVDTSLTDQVAYTFGDFMRCDISGLQWKGASNVTPYVLNNDLNYYEAGKELDLTSLGGRFYKGYSNTLFSQERGLRGFINSLTASSTTAVETLRLTGTNTGGVALNVGLGIRNTLSDGSGYGALVLYASAAGVDNAIAEVYANDTSTGLAPIGTTRALGRPTAPWQNVYSANAVTVTSDRRNKLDIRDVDEALIRAVSNLKPQQYRLKNGDGKWVIGYIAQDVVDAFANEGIDAFEYSVVAKGEDGYLALQYEQLAILKAMVN